MVMMIQSLADIAVEKNRDVLLAKFSCPPLTLQKSCDRFAWADYEPRSEFLAWLADQGIKARFAMLYAIGDIDKPYDGSVYLDLPYDTEDDACKRLLAHAEYGDGTSRLPGVRICVLHLEAARKIWLANSHL